MFTGEAEKEGQEQRQLFHQLILSPSVPTTAAGPGQSQNLGTQAMLSVRMAGT